ncbi:hypothetical protein KCV00_g76, partial [Aureobasidium melanogenum]
MVIVPSENFPAPWAEEEMKGAMIWELPSLKVRCFCQCAMLRLRPPGWITPSISVSGSRTWKPPHHQTCQSRAGTTLCCKRSFRNGRVGHEDGKGTAGRCTRDRESVDLLPDSNSLGIGVSLNDIGADTVRRVLDIEGAACCSANRKSSRGRDQRRDMHPQEENRDTDLERKIIKPYLLDHVEPHSSGNNESIVARASDESVLEKIGDTRSEVSLNAKTWRIREVRKPSLQALRFSRSMGSEQKGTCKVQWKSKRRVAAVPHRCFLEVKIVALLDLDGILCTKNKHLEEHLGCILLARTRFRAEVGEKDATLSASYAQRAWYRERRVQNR